MDDLLAHSGDTRADLAPYACFSSRSRGRLVPEEKSPTRSEFQRDRDRIVHSTAFRRLAYKTQVFVFHEGDHFRNRLTHSLEVGQIARALARAFRVDEDLAEALALSHDFGHTPFGHTGEDALNLLMKPYGGFDHNAQSLRIVSELEKRYAGFNGLNLTWESLEGLVKHNGPLTTPNGKAIDQSVPEAILEMDRKFDLELSSHSSIEAQCAAIADDIAYNGHDLDDGLRAGLFTLESAAELPSVAKSIEEIDAQHPDLEVSRVFHEIVRRQITHSVEDVIRETRRRLSKLKPEVVEDVRAAGETMVSFSEEMAIEVRDIKAFLFKNMYRAPSVMRVREGATRIVNDLFKAYFEGMGEMPEEWRIEWDLMRGEPNDAKRAHLVSDFIAGMTDRYAVLEHRRLFDETPELR